MEIIKIISYWERIKDLINQNNIYDEEAISIIDNFFKNELKNELK